MTNKILLDTGRIGIDDARTRQIITKTNKGIKVDYQSIYDYDQDSISYYREGNYPPIPDSWDTIINSDYHTTSLQLWWYLLEQCIPYRTILT